MLKEAIIERFLDSDDLYNTKSMKIIHKPPFYTVCSLHKRRHYRKSLECPTYIYLLAINGIKRYNQRKKLIQTPVMGCNVSEY